MPRVKLFNKEEALMKAMELFWERGYSSTSLSDLTTHLGIGKGSFYDTFGSKRALFDESFELYRKVNVARIEQLLESEPNVRAGYRKLLELNLEHLMGDHEHKYQGCFIANTCSEVLGEDQVLLDKLFWHYSYIEKILLAYLKRGKIPPKKATAVSELTLTFLIGMSQQSKYKRDKKSYLRSMELLVGVLD